MKSLMLFVFAAAAVAMAATPVLAQSASGTPSPSLSEVAADAATGPVALQRVNDLSARVVPLETALAAAVAQAQAGDRVARAKVAALKKELETAKKALAAAQAALVKEQHAAAIKEAQDKNGLDRLDKLTTAGVNGAVEKWGWLLPTEDPQTALVRRPCAEGTTPFYMKNGESVRYECVPLTDDPTMAATRTSKYVKCLAWGAIGGAVGGAGTYIGPKTWGTEVNAAYVAGGTVLSAGIGYGVCLLAVSR